VVPAVGVLADYFSQGLTSNAYLGLRIVEVNDQRDATSTLYLRYVDLRSWGTIAHMAPSPGLSHAGDRRQALARAGRLASFFDSFPKKLTLRVGTPA